MTIYHIIILFCFQYQSVGSHQSDDRPGHPVDVWTTANGDHGPGVAGTA